MRAKGARGLGGGGATSPLEVRAGRTGANGAPHFTRRPPSPETTLIAHLSMCPLSSPQAADSSSVWAHSLVLCSASEFFKVQRGEAVKLGEGADGAQDRV